MRIDPWLRASLLLPAALSIAGCGRQAPQANNAADAAGNAAETATNSQMEIEAPAMNESAPAPEPPSQTGDAGDIGEPLDLRPGGGRGNQSAGGTRPVDR